MLSLRVFGGLALSGPGGPILGRGSQRRRLALLAILAHARGRPVSRDKIIALLWPETRAERARHLLADSIYVLRRQLGDDVVFTIGDDVALNPERVSSDVEAFHRALEDRNPAGAVERYSAGGAFLDGIHLRNAPEFERWVESTRSHLAGEYAAAVEDLAKEAASRGDRESAIGWWRRLAETSPLSSRVALGLMQALADADDVAGALDFARLHERVVRAELEASPDPMVVAFAEQLRLAATIASKRPIGAPSPATHPQSPPSRSHRALAYGLAVLALTGLALGGMWFRRGQVPHPGPLVRHQPRDIAAYELYVRGRDPALNRSDSGARLGLQYFRGAIAADSTYAPAYAGLAFMYGVLGMTATSANTRRQLFARGEEAALKAIALDDSLAEAHTNLGFVRTVGLIDFESAETELKHALVLDPNDPRPHEYLTHLYLWNGRAPEALAEARRELDTDPLSASARAQIADALYMNGHCDDALAQLRLLAGIRPPLRRAAFTAGLCYLEKGMWREALAEFDREEVRGPRALGWRGYTLARSGQRDQARRILRELLARQQRTSGGAFAIAVLYTGLGDVDQAFPWLERAVGERSLWPEIMGPTLEFLRSDSRFERVRRHLGLVKGHPAPRQSTAVSFGRSGTG